jgi:hypothetical protein
MTNSEHPPGPVPELPEFTDADLAAIPAEWHRELPSAWEWAARMWEPDPWDPEAGDTDA